VERKVSLQDIWLGIWQKSVFVSKYGATDFFLLGHVGSKIIFINHFKCKNRDFVHVLCKWFKNMILFTEDVVGKYTHFYTDSHITTRLNSLSWHINARNEEALHRVKDDGNILLTRKRKKAK
jgi:hypothetical protein